MIGKSYLNSHYIRNKTLPLPNVLWIELTSKCPFRCVFCSRELLRGDGQHMPYHLFEKLIGELEKPKVLRLNFAGESIHYPHLIDAIRLAKSTGANVEIVTTFSSVSDDLIEKLILSGLDLLTISVHTMDDDEYRRIYQFSSLENLRYKLDLFLKLKKRLRKQTPVVDVSFVAMKGNVEQLLNVAEFVEENNLDGINVHRVIRRSPIKMKFSEELVDNRLRPAFKKQLKSVIEETRQRYPGLRISCSNNALEENTEVSTIPQFHSGVLPEDAKINTCIESPFETAHIWSNGDVFPCGCGSDATDVMGNLYSASLKEIWMGDKYMSFRKNYTHGKAKNCKNCSWKMAYIPSPLKSHISGLKEENMQLLAGWYFDDDNGIVWSQAESILFLRKQAKNQSFIISGILPAVPSPSYKTNALTVYCNDQYLGHIENGSNSFFSFESEFDVSHIRSMFLYFKFIVKYDYKPCDFRETADSRLLGFALMRAYLKDKRTVTNKAGWLKEKIYKRIVK
ncbi:MAG: radical SAM protein [Thermodesulfobacteriota bacterium]|nr:radical SAM protein [Thermodesulfobacteriota bacterium]